MNVNVKNRYSQPLIITFLGELCNNILDDKQFYFLGHLKSSKKEFCKNIKNNIMAINGLGTDFIIDKEEIPLYIYKWFNLKTETFVYELVYNFGYILLYQNDFSEDMTQFNFERS